MPPTIEELIEALSQSVHFLEDGPTLSKILGNGELKEIKIAPINDGFSNRGNKFYISYNEGSHTIYSNEAIKVLEYFIEHPSEKDKKSIIENQVTDRLTTFHDCYITGEEEESDSRRPEGKTNKGN